MASPSTLNSVVNPSPPASSFHTKKDTDVNNHQVRHRASSIRYAYIIHLERFISLLDYSSCKILLVQFELTNFSSSSAFSSLLYLQNTCHCALCNHSSPSSRTTNSQEAAPHPQKLQLFSSSHKFDVEELKRTLELVSPSHIPNEYAQEDDG